MTTQLRLIQTTGCVLHTARRFTDRNPWRVWVWEFFGGRSVQTDSQVFNPKSVVLCLLSQRRHSLKTVGMFCSVHLEIAGCLWAFRALGLFSPRILMWTLRIHQITSTTTDRKRRRRRRRRRKRRRGRRCWNRERVKVRERERRLNRADTVCDLHRKQRNERRVSRFSVQSAPTFRCQRPHRETAGLYRPCLIVVISLPTVWPAQAVHCLCCMLKVNVLKGLKEGKTNRNCSLHLRMWEVANKRLMWTWCASFGTNINLGRVLGLQKR